MYAKLREVQEAVQKGFGSAVVVLSAESSKKEPFGCSDCVYERERDVTPSSRVCSEHFSEDACTDIAADKKGKRPFTNIESGCST